MRKLGIGVLVGAAVAFFVRWRGGFSRAVEEIQERLPDEAKPSSGSLAGDPEDATLRDRVMSEVFRDERFKGNVNVAAEYGRIVLHGELERPELVDELVEAVRAVEGVRGVESRLHASGGEVEVELPKRPA